MPTLREHFGGGHVTSRDRALLSAGELQRADNVYYKRGDPHRLFNTKGPTTFGTAEASKKVAFVGLALFDSGTNDALLAYVPSSGKLYSATPGATGSFSTLLSGLDTTATRGSLVHFNDEHYFHNGKDRGRVLLTDGTTEFHGMLSPNEKPAVTLSDGSAGAVVRRPAAVDSNDGWDDTGNAYDANTGTFAKASLSSADTATLVLDEFPTDATVTRLDIKWRLAGLQEISDTPDGGGGGDFDGGLFGIGGAQSSGYNVTIRIRLSTDAGTNWTTIMEQTRSSSQPRTVTTQAVLTGGTVVSGATQTQVELKLTYNSGTNRADLQVYDVSGALGVTTGDTALFTPTTGFYYCWSEYNATLGREGAIGPVSDLTTGSSINMATVPIPSAAQNTGTTHFRLYRTPDGGTEPDDLGYMADVPVSQAGGSFFDPFVSPRGQTDQPRPLSPRVTVSISDGTIRISRNTPPPGLVWINTFKGRLVGTPADSPRELRGSVAGDSWAWPEINLIPNFPFPQHDQIVYGTEVADVFLIGAKGLMIVLTDFPEVTAGVFNAAQVYALTGAPGLASQYGLTNYSVRGESMAAWVSHFGVHITNGNSSQRISDDLDWENEVAVENLSGSALHYDYFRDILILSANSRSAADGASTNEQDADLSSTDNDREWLFHMSNIKENGLPRVTRRLAGAATSYTSQIINGVHRVYYGHATNGTVHQWEAGAGEAFHVQGRRAYADWDLMMASKVNLRSTDFGPGQTCAATLRSGRDAPNNEQSVSRTIGLSSGKGTEVSWMRSGEWLEMELVGPAGVSGALLDARIEARSLGPSGRKTA